MEFKPHDYQLYAIDFILNHEEAAVLLDMGPGQDRDNADSHTLALPGQL